MISQQPHTVKTITFDLDLNHGQDPGRMRQRVISNFKDSIQTQLAAAMDQICNDEEVIRIEKLVIDLGDITPDNILNGLVEQLSKQLGAYVQDVKFEQERKESGRVDSSLEPIPLQGENFRKLKEERLFDVFIFVLKNGSLPWWYTNTKPLKLNDILETILESSNDQINISKIEQLKTIVEKDKIVRQRLIWQCEPKQIQALIKIWFTTEIKQSKGIIEFFKILSKSLFPGISNTVQDQILLLLTINQIFEKSVVNRAIIQEETFAKFIKEFIGLIKIVRPHLIQLKQIKAKIEGLKANSQLNAVLRKVLKENQTEPTQEHPQTIIRKLEKAIVEAIAPKNKATDSKRELIDESVSSKAQSTCLINHAGIVIVWPLLSTLFENRNLLENNMFKDESAKNTALDLLNYLTFGHEDAEEFDMPLNKILCGIGFNEPIPPRLKLTDEDKAEVDALLAHLINTWTAIKNTSPKGLRDSFINRPGELIEREDSWLLKVEQRSIDIIMDRIPWGFRMIKLPWTDKIIQVEW